jgi:hypothetical protein
MLFTSLGRVLGELLVVVKANRGLVLLLVINNSVFAAEAFRVIFKYMINIKS